MQFSAICYNLLGQDPIHHPNATGNYLTTGSWSAAAIKEAGKYCNPNEVASNKEAKYATLSDPSEWNINKDAKYFHYCSNETI
jgi:phosphoserine aminotransferase